MIRDRVDRGRARRRCHARLRRRRMVGPRGAPGRAGAIRPWSLLAWNAALPAEVRLRAAGRRFGSTAPRRHRRQPDETLDDRIAAASAGLRVAMRRLAGVSTAGETHAEPLVPLANDRGLCRGTGFPVHERAAGTIERAGGTIERACGTIAVDPDRIPRRVGLHQATVTLPGPGAGSRRSPVLDARLDATRRSRAAAARRRSAAGSASAA